MPTGWQGTGALCLRSTLTPNRRRRFRSPWQSCAYCVWVSCAASKHVSRWSSFCGDPQPQLTKEALLRTHKTTPHPASQPHSTPASQHKTTPHGDAVTTTGRSRETEGCSSAVENGKRPASRRPRRAVQQRPVRICPTATAIQLTRSLNFWKPVRKCPRQHECVIRPYAVAVTRPGESPALIVKRPDLSPVSSCILI